MPTSPKMHVAVDAVVFGYQASQGLSVLLVKRRYEPHQGVWALPGGFVQEDESLERAVSRELEEETGVELRYLEQLFTFGAPERDPRRRVISVAYFALVRLEGKYPVADTDAEDAAWFGVQDLPPLAFDHAHILKTGITRLRNKITYEPIGFELLEEKFPFSDLLTLYETLLERTLDRRNFKKKIRAMGILEELDETRKQSGSGRPAKLYRFNQEEYFSLKEKGMFEILFPLSSGRGG